MVGQFLLDEVATHPDADHVGGLINVLKLISVKNFIDSGKTHTTDTYYDANSNRLEIQ